MTNKLDRLTLAIQQLDNAHRNLLDTDLPDELILKCSNVINNLIYDIVDAKAEIMKDKKALYYELAIEFLENVRDAAIEDKEYDSVNTIEAVINELKDIKNK